MAYRLTQFAAGCFALGIVFTACPNLQAQTPTDPGAIIQSQENQSAGLAATWLGSGDARTRAWGAYLALRDHRRELLPQLIGLMDVYAVKSGLLTSSGADDHQAALGVLDAIIQMDRVEGVQEASGLSVLPPEDAARLYPEFPAQALILLARAGPAAATFLLDIFNDNDTGPTSAWLAAGNLLTHWKPPGFAAAVLGNFTIDAGIRVVDDGSGAASGTGIGGSCSSGGPSFRGGWPPVGNYSLGRGNGIFLAGNADRSSYTRTLGSAADDRQSNDDRCAFLRGNRNLVREHFLSDLVFDPFANPSVRSSVKVTITWHNNDQYIADLRALIRQQQDALDNLIQKLRSAGLLSVEDGVSSRPTLQMKISDERGTKPSNLPVLPNPGGNVKITDKQNR